VLLDWREHARMLKLRFATAVDDPEATYEIPYGAIQRPANGEEEPGQRWIDVSGQMGGEGMFGLAVLNDAKYGFDIHDAELGVTAVRSPIYAHHEPTIPKSGVRYQHQDIGSQRFTLRLVPHRGRWSDAGLTRRAIELNQRPTVLIESFHEGPLPLAASYAAVTPDNVAIGAIKVAEDGDGLVVRVVETAGVAADAQVELPSLGCVLDVPLGPFQIRSYRVPRERGSDAVEVDLLERPIAVPAPA
jgi:alpha-mannosidase